VAATNLYRGQHWAVVRELPAVAQASGFQADLWVASAGYGLIPAEAQVRPYSATFGTSDEDGVWRPSDGDRRRALQTWWNGLQEMAGPVPFAPRSLAALARTSPDAIILVVASPVYLAAMAGDLKAAREQLADPQHLLVISSRNDSSAAWLTPHLVPSEAPLSGILGGARGSLHARTARIILREAATVPLQADILVPRYIKLVSQAESPSTPVRVRLLDEEVRRFICQALAENRNIACTTALRKLRTSGQACEQRRFTGLFEEIRRRADVA
jgi:hypothetical protein